MSQLSPEDPEGQKPEQAQTPDGEPTWGTPPAASWAATYSEPIHGGPIYGPPVSGPPAPATGQPGGYQPGYEPSGYQPGAIVPTGVVPPGAAIQSYAPNQWVYGAPQPVPYPIVPKNPGISLLVSLFLPGVGSLMNGDVGVGVTILVLCWLVLPLTALITCGFGLLLYPVVWIWALIDAYTGAQRWNAQHGFIS